MDFHQEYLKDGEKIYAPRVNKSEFLSGKNRIQGSVWLYNSPNVSKVVYLWNDGVDSCVYDVTPTTGLDEYNFYIQLAEEKTYNFEIYTIDKWGNHSLKDKSFATVYGEHYQQTISNRILRKAEMNNGVGVLSWYGGAAGFEQVEVEYLDADGNLQTVFSDSEQMQTSCENINASTPQYRYRSHYRPEATAIDTFVTPWSDYAIFPSLLDRSSWQVIAVSSQPNGFSGSNILDNNFSTIWHSDWNIGAQPPHYIIVDMKSEVDVFSIDLYRRRGFAHTKTVQLYTSNQVPSLQSPGVLLGTLSYGSDASKYLQTLTLATPQAGRYLVILVTESYNTDGSASIEEVFVTGIKK